MAESPSTQLRPLRDYRGRVPGHRPGTRTHLATLIRWAAAGVRAPDGRRVRLRAARVGSRWFTTDDWFDQFLAAQAPADPAGPTPDIPRSPAARTRAGAAAAAELDRLGVR